MKRTLFVLSLILSSATALASTQHFSASYSGVGSYPNGTFVGCIDAGRAAVEQAFNSCAAVYGKDSCGGPSSNCGSTESEAWSKGCVAYEEDMTYDRFGQGICTVTVTVAGSNSEAEKATWVSYVKPLPQIGKYVVILGGETTPHEDVARFRMETKQGYLKTLSNSNFNVSLGLRHVGHDYGGRFEFYAKISPLRPIQGGELAGAPVCVKERKTCERLVSASKILGDDRFQLTASCRPAKRNDGCPRSGLFSAGYVLESTLNVSR